MQNGTIKWFNAKKGYGFITADDGKEIFMHYTALKMEGYKTINEGEKVQFEITNGEKGPQADNVTKL